MAIESPRSLLALLAAALLVGGSMGVAAGRFGLLEKADQYPILKILLWPYRVLDIRWLGGGRSRAITAIGWGMLGTGLVIALGLIMRRL